MAKTEQKPERVSREFRSKFEQIIKEASRAVLIQQNRLIYAAANGEQIADIYHCYEASLKIKGEETIYTFNAFQRTFADIGKKFQDPILYFIPVSLFQINYYTFTGNTDWEELDPKQFFSLLGGHYSFHQKNTPTPIKLKKLSHASKKVADLIQPRVE